MNIIEANKSVDTRIEKRNKSEKEQTGIICFVSVVIREKRQGKYGKENNRRDANVSRHEQITIEY